MAIEFGPKDIYRTYGVPSLDLTFADKKSLVDRISGNNLITFTRSTTGTYVGSDGLIKTASVNEARFDHNPLTRESLGLLVEEARTNLITYSEQFDNAAWVKQTNTTVTANTHVAPDGTTTADTINAIGNQIIGSATVTANITYTVSVFIRKTTGATIFPMLSIDQFTSGAQRVFNTNTGQLVVRDAALNTGIQCESVGSYWRVSYSSNVGANTILNFLIYPAASTDGSSYTGVLTGSIVAWGAQVEAGAFPTSYIPTTASTVTRAADVASITGTNFSSWYRQDEGTTLCASIAKSAANGAVYTITDGSGTLSSLTLNNAPSVYYWFVFNALAAQVSSVLGSNLTGALKSALACKANNFAGSVNGATVITDNVGTLGTMSQLNIGRYWNGSDPFSGTIARLTYYQTRLPDTTLQALTKL